MAEKKKRSWTDEKFGKHYIPKSRKEDFRPDWYEERFMGCVQLEKNPGFCMRCVHRAYINSDDEWADDPYESICEIYMGESEDECKPEDIDSEGAPCEHFKEGEFKALPLLIGLAVGDALGVPVEFQRRGTFHITGMQGYGTHNQPPGTWSDDTSLSLILAENLFLGTPIDSRIKVSRTNLKNGTTMAISPPTARSLMLVEPRRGL